MTTTEVKAALEVTKAIADMIKEVGSVPSGELYVRCMGHLTLDQYQGVIRLLERTGLVKESNNLLTWVG